jgi:multidrug transporter EmrE-like cation transporter
LLTASIVRRRHERLTTMAWLLLVAAGLLEIVVSGEAVSAARSLFLSLIVVGIVGLRLVES